ncbi:MAG: hypothetical protein LBQ22_01835 [Bacteroidales bacterium]|jgi:hypothetical protein|nr:hypothetical protein [Bacteroidales bacterium]
MSTKLRFFGVKAPVHVPARINNIGLKFIPYKPKIKFQGARLTPAEDSEINYQVSITHKVI